MSAEEEKADSIEAQIADKDDGATDGAPAEESSEAIMAGLSEDDVASKSPIEELLVEEPPAEELPADESPADAAPVEGSPVDEVPVEGTAVDEVPVEDSTVGLPAEATVEETPSKEPPAEEVNAEEPLTAESLDASSVEQSAEANPALDYALADIDPARVKRANRTRILLILLIILLLGALAGLSYLGYTMLTSVSQSSSSLIGTDPVKLDGSSIQDSTSSGGSALQTTTIPNLKQLFGLGLEQVQAKLTSDFALTKTEETTDSTNPDIHSLATFSYQPQNNTSGGGTSTGAMASSASRVENIYLSLNNEGKVIEVYYVASLDLLGYPDSDFTTLLSKSDTVDGILKSAGVAPVAGWKYEAPSPDSCIQYVDPTAEQPKVKKLTTSFYAATDSSDAAPANWNLTITYDYGASGVILTPDTAATQRMIYLKLY